MPPRPEARGAIPIVLHAELAALRERHDVTLVTVAGDEPGELEAVSVLAGSGVDVHMVDRTRASAARRRRRFQLASTWARGRYPWRTAWFADPRVQQTIDSLTESQSFDLAVVEDNSMGVFRLPAELPSVLTEHEVRRPRAVDWRCGAPANWPRWAFHEADWRRWPAYQRSVWSRFDRIQVFTERDAAVIAELAPHLRERVRVTPFGIDAPPAADPAREQPGLVLFVGNFTHPPNVDAACWLVDGVMPRLRALVPGSRLLLVGGAADSIDHLAAADVDVVADVDALAPYLEEASVVVAPVRTGGGMRMKVLYALASGKAVVTTPRGAEGLVSAGSEPPFVLADDADGIANAVARLLGDDRSRRQLGARARSFVLEHYDTSAYARRLETVFDELIAERHRIADRSDA
jgi:glycosyltransferase involved in cell wall biosynthesis